MGTSDLQSVVGHKSTDNNLHWRLTSEIQEGGHGNLQSVAAWSEAQVQPELTTGV